MNKFRLLGLIIVIMVITGCGKNISFDTPLENLSADYSLKDAKKSGCVVHEDGDITTGQEIWDEFLEKVENKEPANVRLAYYYTLDEETCDPEYYESVKDDYPVLYIKDLTYDGENYTVRFFEEGEEYSRSYKYMKKFIDKPESDTAVYSVAVRYFLLNDKSIESFDEIMRSLYSSDSRDWIEFDIVYTDYTYKEEYITDSP